MSKDFDCHRVWFKLLLNPILRKFGFSIVSCFQGDQLIRYALRPYPKYCRVIGDEE